MSHLRASQVCEKTGLRRETGRGRGLALPTGMRSLAAAYPVLSVSPAPDPTLPCAPALIERVVTLRNATPDDDVMLVQLEGDGLAHLQCQSNTPGYRAHLLPQRTRFGRTLIVGVRIEATDRNTTEPCALCFTAGPSMATLAVSPCRSAA